MSEFEGNIDRPEFVYYCPKCNEFLVTKYELDACMGPHDGLLDYTLLIDLGEL